MATVAVQFVFCGCCNDSGEAPGFSENAIEWRESDQSSVTGTGTPATEEQYIKEISVDFDLLDPSLLLLACTLTALTSQPSGTGGVYRIRMDGAQGQPDGTLLVTLTTANPSYPDVPDGATGALARPIGKHILKLTGEAVTDDSPGTALIKAMSLVIGKA